MLPEQRVVHDDVDARDQDLALVPLHDHRVSEDGSKPTIRNEQKRIYPGSARNEVNLGPARPFDEMQAPVEGADEPHMILRNDGGCVEELRREGRIACREVRIGEGCRPVPIRILDHSCPGIPREEGTERIHVVDRLVPDDRRGNDAHDGTRKDQAKRVFDFNG